MCLWGVGYATMHIKYSSAMLSIFWWGEAAIRGILRYMLVSFWYGRVRWERSLGWHSSRWLVSSNSLVNWQLLLVLFPCSKLQFWDPCKSFYKRHCDVQNALNIYGRWWSVHLLECSALALTNQKIITTRLFTFIINACAAKFNNTLHNTLHCQWVYRSVITICMQLIYSCVPTLPVRIVLSMVVWIVPK